MRDIYLYIVSCNMAMKALLFGVVVLTVLQTCLADDKCHEGEVFKTGQSSSCGEKKCGDRDKGPKPCTIDYVSRCFSEYHLYRRQTDDKCVPKEEC